jgi:hypothetical protein
MRLTANLPALKKFRKFAWRFQQTFETPLKSLPPFVSAICQAGDPWKSASVTLEQVVFDPTNVIELLKANAISPRYEKGVSIIAESKVEIAALLIAALGDYFDFIFVPEPKSIAILSDHDGYTTIYAQTRSNLNRVTIPLTDGGFHLVKDYEREL